MRSILLTGANQGLGFWASTAIAATPGVKLFIAGRSLDKLQEALKKIEVHKESKVIPLLIDLTKDDTIEAAAKAVEKELGGEGLDVLVNNAAIAPKEDYGEYPLGSNPREPMLAAYNTNVVGTSVVIQFFLPLLLKESTTREKGVRGRVVTVSSTVSNVAAQNRGEFMYASYAPSKSALNALTGFYKNKYKSLQWISLCPGYNATNLNGERGFMHPRDGSKIISNTALEVKEPYGGESEFWNEAGRIEW